MTKNTDTKTIILNVAFDLFSEYGYAETSIKMIAVGANISTSLIFHHFESKEALWVQVEKHAIAKQITDFPPVREGSLEEFLYDLVSLRIRLYKDDKFRRFIMWRSLEHNLLAGLTGQETKSEKNIQQLLNLPDCVSQLQARGLITQKIDSSVAAMLIFTNSTYAVHDYVHYYKIPADRIEDYTNKVVEALHRILKAEE